MGMGLIVYRDSYEYVWGPLVKSIGIVAYMPISVFKHALFRSFRVQRSLFTDADMSGEDKVHWMFFVPHVLGHQTLCLPQPLRQPVLQVFAAAQLMTVASRGRRAYNIGELTYIFDQGFLQFFTAMERVNQINHDRIYNKRLEKHRRNPARNRAPTRFRRQNRYVMRTHTKMHEESDNEP